MNLLDINMYMFNDRSFININNVNNELLHDTGDVDVLCTNNSSFNLYYNRYYFSNISNMHDIEFGSNSHCNTISALFSHVRSKYTMRKNLYNIAILFTAFIAVASYNFDEKEISYCAIRNSKKNIVIRINKNEGG